jgi:hypothetical protein
LSTSWEQAVRTHPVDKLLEQHCYKSAAGLLQLVRFYQRCMPSPGFYPEISGFFEAVGIFLGFLFLKVNLGIFLDFLRKGSFLVIRTKCKVLQVFEAMQDRFLVVLKAF